MLDAHCPDRGRTTLACFTSAIQEMMAERRPTLLALAHAKIVYQEILRDCSDAHWDAANSAEFEASKAFKDALIANTGIPENVWLSLGFVF